MTDQNKSELAAPLRAHSIVVEDFKRIEYVRLDIRRGLNVIGGANRQGKSSFIDAVELAFSGKGKVPIEPIRKGKRRAHINVKAGDGSDVKLTIDVEIRADGTYKANVLGADGQPIPGGGATFLKGLFNREAFDPFRFSRLGPTEQDAVLKEISGLDFTKNDTETKRVKELISSATRDLKAERARLDAAPRHDGVPDKETSVAEAAEALEMARIHNRARDLATERVASDERAFENAMAAVDRAREALKNAEAAKMAAERRRDESEQALKAMAPAVDVAPLQDVVRTAEDTNRKVRENAARAALSASVDALEAKLAGNKATLEKLGAARQKQIESAKFPVPGLSFDDIGPTYNGFPLDQASHSDKLKIGAAIEMSRHPGLGLLLIRDGEKHGTEDLKFLEEFALEHGFDVILERMTETGEGCHIVLEDGKARTGVAAE